jgi:hypothetical protein
VIGPLADLIPSSVKTFISFISGRYIPIGSCG